MVSKPNITNVVRATTRSSSQVENVKNAVVIRFTNGACYRDQEVDFANGFTLRLLGISPMSSGGSQGGLRASIPRIGQPKPECRVRIDNREFEVIVDYSGPVSTGIENC